MNYIDKNYFLKSHKLGFITTFPQILQWYSIAFRIQYKFLNNFSPLLIPPDSSLGSWTPLLSNTQTDKLYFQPHWTSFSTKPLSTSNLAECFFFAQSTLTALLSLAMSQFRHTPGSLLTCRTVFMLNQIINTKHLVNKTWPVNGSW